MTHEYMGPESRPNMASVSWCPPSIAFFGGTGSALKRTAHADEQDWSYVRRRWRAWFNAQADLDPEHLVFIDDLWRGIGESLDAFTPTQRANFSAAADYELE